jgi:hypothetical protein
LNDRQDGVVGAGDVRRRSTWREPAVEIGFLLLGLGCYLSVRWLALGRTDVAVENARTVLSVERALGLDWESAGQDLMLETPWARFLFTMVYAWGYLPVVAGTLVWLYGRHRDAYRHLRTALLWSGAMGLIVYATFPCAPPRLTAQHYLDTVEAHGLDAVARPPGIANELAAMPSFHCGWLVLAAVVAYPVLPTRALRAACVVHPILMCVAVVVTGNHWVLDIPAGLVLALVGLLAARRFSPVPHDP